MRISAVGSIFLSLSFFVLFAGCTGGDTGEKVGNDAKKLASDIMPEMAATKGDAAKLKEVETKSKIDAIEVRYKALSADEKKKADAIQPGIGEMGKMDAGKSDKK